MNNRNAKVRVVRCLGTVVGCLWLLVSSSIAAAVERDTAEVIITAHVYAVCTVTAPDAVVLKRGIPHNVVVNASPGTDLIDYKEEFEIEAKCSGTNNYNYTFQPTNVRGQCVGSNDTDMLRFCLDIQDSTSGITRLDMSSGQAKYSTTGEKTKVRIVPQVGTISALATDYSGTFSITISPE